MNLAIIPARGGSTRLKDKNIYPLGGKPLIQWTVDAALHSEEFDKIIVSSDSDKILSSVEGDVVLHKRDAKFATKEVPVLELIMHLTKEHRYDYDTVAYLLPTCPFRSAEHIKQAFVLNTVRNSVVTVVEYQEPIQLAGTLSPDSGNFTPYFDNLLTGKTNSLFMTKYYRPNGGIYLTHSETLLAKHSFFKGSLGAVPMNKIESHDINDLFDMKIAEAIISEGLLK